MKGNNITASIVVLISFRSFRSFSLFVILFWNRRLRVWLYICRCESECSYGSLCQFTDRCREQREVFSMLIYTAEITLEKS
jgi:hypothetical protein